MSENMTPDIVREIIAETAIVTIFGIVGVIALGIGLRSADHGRAPTLLLAWAVLQLAVNEIAGGSVLRVLGGPTPASRWVSTLGGYFVAVPWALLFVRMLGRGWRSTILLTTVLFIVFAVAFTLFDVINGMPGAAVGLNRIVVAAGAGVVIVHLFAMKTGEFAQLEVLRAGFLAFMGLVVHDVLARARMLPWRTESGPWAPLIAVAAIGYAVVTETIRRRSDLWAVEYELATARRIQLGLLPARPPALDGATVSFRYVPAAAVAGDVFDFVEAGPRRVGILVADVSGHGVPAALIASMVKVAAAAQKPHAGDPARVLAGIHLALAEGLPPAQFVTAVYAHVDLDLRILQYASAGHPPPVIWRAADASILAEGETGPLIISLAPAQYPVTKVSLAAGDRLLLYSDGVTEANGADDEMFGVERLRALFAQPAGGIDRIVSSILEAVIKYRHGVGGGALDDDCTLVALEVGGVGSQPSITDLVARSQS